MIPDATETPRYQVQHEPPPAGTSLLIPAMDTLSLDLDTDEQMRMFLARLPALMDLFPVKSVRIWPSRSKGVHALVQISEYVSDGIATALELFLGSDPYRGLYNSARIVGGVEDPRRLFKPVKP